MALSGESPPIGSGADPVGAQLYQRLGERIEAAGGALPFVDFMELALYDPDYGYYTGTREQFGAAGDFITAPELSPLLAQCVAQCADAVLDQLGGGAVLEAGAGTGRLAADLLRHLPQPDALTGYQILERSPVLRQRQRRLLQAQVPEWMDRIEWIETLPEAGFRGLLFANELLDAIAVHRIEVTEWGVAEIHVARDADRLAERLGPPTSQRLVQRLQGLQLPVGYRTEVGLRQEAWVLRAGAAIERGALLLIDYGYPRSEYYHPQRSTGTLLCHYRHQAHTNPYLHLGRQDITAHVDFTGVAEATVAAGLELLGFTTQAGFLLEGGALERSGPEAGQDAFAALRQAQVLKRLLLPGQMGDLFKVLLAARGLESAPPGFAAMDQRRRL